jgi:dynein assembly factor 5
VNNSAIDGAIPVLAQKTYDANVDVRKCLIAVTGSWLMCLVDRYSYQWKLIPILLCCLSDDVAELRRSAWEIWDQVGKKYEQENEQELKDQMDFAEVVSLPQGLEFGRPRLGCRVIVQRNFHKVLPPLLKDMCDWSLKSRLKASQLLFHLLYHLEDHITQSLQLLLGGLYGGCSDEESEIVDNSAKCANMVGFYVPVEIWSDLVLGAVRTSSGCGKQGKGVGSSVAVGPIQCTGCLRCFSGLLQGAPKDETSKCLKGIVKCLAEPELFQTKHRPIQKGILCCVQSILQKKLMLDHDDIRDMFLILLRLSSVEADDHWHKQVQESLMNLCVCAGHSEVSELYSVYGKEILQPMIDRCDLWTPFTPDCLVFTSFVKNGCTAVVSFSDDIIPVFCSALKPDNSVELHLHFIVLLIEFLRSVQEADKLEFHQHAATIVTDIIIPNTVWKAGRTAAALRTSMMASLLTLLDNSLLSISSVEDFMERLLPQVLSCLDDSNESTRKMSCQALSYLIPAMNVDKLHTIYCELLKRLDDSVEDIRLCMTQTLLVYFRAFPDQYDSAFYKAHCEAMYSALLIHLDDSHEMMQESVLTVLKEASRLNAELLKEKIESVYSKHRSQKYCDELLLQISSSSS